MDTVSQIETKMTARKPLPVHAWPDQLLKYDLVVSALNRKYVQPATANRIRDFATLALLFPTRSGNTAFAEMVYDCTLDAHMNPPHGSNIKGETAFDRPGYVFMSNSIVWVEADLLYQIGQTPESIVNQIAARVTKTNSEVPLIVFVGSGWSLFQPESKTVNT